MRATRASNPNTCTPCALRLNRSDLVPRFMIGLEGSLASLGQSVGPVQPTAPAWSGGHNLSPSSTMRRWTKPRCCATSPRGTVASSFALHLLGQRFGVLAASPALDIERLPCAPHSLCAILRDSVETLHCPPGRALLLYRTFDRLVMSQHAQLAETINATMAADGLLPALRYVPTRCGTRPPPRRPLPANRPRAIRNPHDDAAPHRAEPASEQRQPAKAQFGPRRRTGAVGDPQQPHTAWPGLAGPSGMQGDDSAAFELLQQLLAGRRELLGKFRPGATQAPLQNARTQRSARGLAAAASATGPGAQASVGDIKQDLLARMRQQRGKGATLSGGTTTPSNCSACCTARSSGRCIPTRHRRRCSTIAGAAGAAGAGTAASSCARSIPRACC